jgi:superoxide dismutase
VKEDFFGKVIYMTGMECFLSEDAIELHKAYLNNLKLRYSVLEKCYPEIKGKSIQQLGRIKSIRREEKIIEAKGEIICHELFFNSFGSPYQSSKNAREQYRSEACFLYEMQELASNNYVKYIIAYTDYGKIKIKAINRFFEMQSISNPVLSLDVCEHAYFMNYAFDKEKYIKSALSYVNLSQLDSI